MKVKYFYDGQIRRHLLHIVRMFSSFQVFNGYTSTGKPKYKVVPCKLQPTNRMMGYTLTNYSENVMNSAPFITVSIKNISLDKKQVRAPVQLDSQIAVNKSPDVNQYEDKLEEVLHVTRMNPTPYKMEFEINIWTTTLESKMELFEQIASLLDPNTVLQMTTNPLDWTGTSDIVLEGNEWSSLPSPLGTTDDIDIAKFKFSSTIWLSLPAKVRKATLIEQIVNNMNIVNDDFDIDFPIHDGNVVIDVYTPKNLGIGVKELDNSMDYELTLLYSSNTEKQNSLILDWNKLLSKYDPEHDNKDKIIRFYNSVDDSMYFYGNIISIGDDDTANKLKIKFDFEQFKYTHTISSFITSIDDIDDILNKAGDKFINMSDVDIVYMNKHIKPNELFELTESGFNIIETKSNELIRNAFDNMIYVNNKYYGWIRFINTLYTNGLWKVGIRG